MKIIFLDIDGVLNSEKELRKGLGTDLSNDKIKLLKEIIKATKAGIVLSSSWREIESEKNKVITMCKNNKIKYLGETVRGVKESKERKCYSYYSGITYDRGAEINHYLKTNKIKDNYIIIDDEIVDIKNWIDENHIVETTLWDGLTKDKVKEAIQKLNN